MEERIDPTGPFGEFTLTVLLAVSALELNNIKAGWDTAKQRAVSRGAFIGPTPFGYYRQDEHNGVLQKDPETGPMVTEAFDRAARSGLQAAVAYLTSNDPDRSRVWTTSTVRRLLEKRSYLGESKYGDVLNGDAHEALTTRATWEAAQPPEPQRRRARADFPLSGLPTCGTCGTHMTGARGGPSAAPIRTYRCAAGVSGWPWRALPRPGDNQGRHS